MVISLTAALATLVSASAACRLPAATAVPWGERETLTFELNVPRTGSKARAMLRASGGAGQILLAGEAELDAPLGIYRARGTAHSWLEPDTLRPTRYADEIVDPAGRETSAATFGRGPAVRIEWTDGARRGVNAFVRQPDVLDALSAIYYLRAAELRAGAPLCFDLVGGRKAWRVTASVGAPERVETGAGTFTAFRIEGRATRTDRSRETARLQLWVSADARRLPVKATVKFEAGTLRALLASVVSDGRRDE
jgi:hypothetical protein